MKFKGSKTLSGLVPPMASRYKGKGKASYSPLESYFDTVRYPVPALSTGPKSYFVIS